MAEKEYIDRGALLAEDFTDSFVDVYDVPIFEHIIESAPAADVAPVVHARWIDRDDKTWCSRCDASNKQYKPPYCPHCGARMDGGKHG
jgi:uncharacterized paraquat-inducible protein A